MKKFTLFLSLFLLVSLACDLAVTVAPGTSPAPLPTNTALPVVSTPVASATEIPASATSVPATLIPEPTSGFQGAAVSYSPISFIIPQGVASGFSGSQFPRADGENVAPWELTPGHTQVKLEGYLLQGKFHQPQIFVYPAMDYVELVPGAFESIHRLDNILYGPGGTISKDQLPVVPFFNAQPLFASNIQVLSFQNGGGVRFLTEYSQYAAPVNNYELIYQFQGLTRDGEYYVIAILPITVPVLAETSDAGAALPIGGIPYPYLADPNADMQAYYTSVTGLLNDASPQAFAPVLDQLDLLIGSMRIAP